MRRGEILSAVEEVAALPPGSLRGDEELALLFGWDSLSGIAFRVAVQRRWNISLSGPALSRCRTVADILGLLRPHLSET